MTPQYPYPLSESDLNNLRTWFSRYVHSFYSQDAAVQRGLLLKEKHSLKVCDEILDIGRKLHLSDKNLRLAETMALLHDIGRFEQFTRYRTFVDRKSENHGELGVKVLQQEKTLRALNEGTRDLILKTILYHNRLSIPEDETPVCIYFTKLLRDADKLDIFAIASTYYANHAEKSSAIELDLPDTPEVSNEVLAGIRERKMVGMRQLRSLNDFKLLQMAWVYDVHFQPAFQMIYERDYLRKIRDTLPESEKIDRIYADLQSYVKKKSEISDPGQVLPF